jgi:hypothetical protein
VGGQVRVWRAQHRVCKRCMRGPPLGVGTPRWACA